MTKAKLIHEVRQRGDVFMDEALTTCYTAMSQYGSKDFEQAAVLAKLAIGRHAARKQMAEECVELIQHYWPEG